jgi:hypothetical protein
MIGCVRAPSARSTRFDRYPYRIVYVIGETGSIHILAIPHNRRRPLYWKGRLRRFT